jgi:predicted nucleotidyltransferase
MIATLEDATEKLIRDYNPERIILFGSYETEAQTAGSDIDLLIIKKTGKRPIDRRIEVERLLSPRSLPLDLTVYTPDEVRELFSAGSPFIEEVLETGRLLYMLKATAGASGDSL